MTSKTRKAKITTTVHVPFPLGRERTAAEKRREAMQFAADVKAYGKDEALRRKYVRAKQMTASVVAA